MVPAAGTTKNRVICHARKPNPLVSERTVCAEETLRRAKFVAAAKGVTRLANITGLDRIGIAVHSAIVPNGGDWVSVYSGKGVTPNDSRASALMEAIERQTAFFSVVDLISESYRALREKNIAVAHPRDFNHQLREDYSDERVYEWVEAYDLLAEEAILVPAGLACYGPRYTGIRSPYLINSSNGLASGNCFEEAVCHALCELLERDAWTLAELKSHWIPLARRKALFGERMAGFGIDDPNAYPRIDLRNAGDPIARLMEKFYRAGLQPVVRDITSDFGIPCVIASAADHSIPDFPQAHAGTGSHPQARIAVGRALTELAQSRAVDIQGVREDLMPADVPVHRADARTQRVQKIQPQGWMLQQAGAESPLSAVSSTTTDDIAEDIRLILSRLAANGIERVIALDLSEPGPFSVVRVLVPGLEFWALDRGKLGSRALRFWQEHV